MPTKQQPTAYTYLRHSKKFPHVWCPGCGIGIIMGSIIRAVDSLGLDQDHVAIVSGIGCTSRMPVYMDFNTMHTTHGRALAFATGLKLARPDMTIIVVMGDGDALAIGGNHFIHAARRNIGLTSIIVNNEIYGMTGGQVGPTTPVGARTVTSPYGCFEHPFNIPYLAAASGAVYVARWTMLHVRRLERSIGEALAKRGFSLVEIIAPCPTNYDRWQKRRTGLDSLRYYHQKGIIQHGVNPRDVDINVDGGEIIEGVFVNVEKPTFSDFCQEGLSKAMGSRE